MSKPNLQKIEEMLKRKNYIHLTDKEYQKLTGLPLPKEKWYIINRSALAKLATDNAYEIQVIEKQVILRKKGAE